VSGAPVANERDRLKTWWRDLVSGIRNVFATEIVNADSVTPVVIGEGLSELSNATLTGEKRQDIATALGVPQSVIFSESAGGLGGAGVVTMDERHFYDKTVLPETELIAEAWNSQLLAPLGLRIEFRPETLDVYQEDENQRAAAFATYVNAGLPLEVAGPMVGLELPPGWDWDKLAASRRSAARRWPRRWRAGTMARKTLTTHRRWPTCASGAPRALSAAGWRGSRVPTFRRRSCRM